MSFSSPNYTQVPNDLFELMKDMGEAELRVAMVIVRYTFGYHRDKVEMSLVNIARISGLAESNVISGAKALEERGLVERVTDKDNPRQPTLWKIKVDDITSEAEVKNDDCLCSRGDITSVAEVLLNKEINKELNKPEEQATHHRNAEEYKAEVLQAMVRGNQNDYLIKEAIQRNFHLSPNWKSKQWINVLFFLKNLPGGAEPVAALDHFAEWWYHEDWRGKSGQPPNAGQIMELWPQAFKPCEVSQPKPPPLPEQVDGQGRLFVYGVLFSGARQGWIYQAGIKTDKPAPIGFEP